MKEYYNWLNGSVNRLFGIMLAVAVLFLIVVLADRTFDLGWGLSSKKELLLAIMLPISFGIFLFTKGIIGFVADIEDHRNR
ncbi:MAG: hypothetical protein ABJO01_11570 [Parasphingorhabdus sp.]|uniref:hypothetical protein n=1 Tax=Parasphingorhabdus sp. TaxID=2709688 RepID=UPI0032994B3B